MDEHRAGQVAASAAAVYENFFVPALFGAWPPRVLDAAGAKSGDSVLDVACGTGVLARAAAQVVGPPGAVAGTDINPAMLAVAARLAPEITWRAAPAEALPFPDHSFDRVVSQFGLMFFADQAAALREMARVLRPGGRMAVAVWGRLVETPGYAAVAALLDELFGPDAAQSIRAPYALGDPAALRALFADAGLGAVEVRALPGEARFASLEEWIYTDIKGWTLADQIDDAGYALFRHHAQERLAPFVQPDGAVAFPAPARVVVVVK